MQHNPAHILGSSEGLNFLLRLMADAPGMKNPVYLLAPDALRRIIFNKRNESLLPSFYYAIIHNHVDVAEDIRRPVENSYAAQYIRSEKLAGIITAIEDEYKKNRIRYRVFKGTAIARLLYPWPEIRCGRDIDFVVCPEQIHAAVELLKCSGWRLIESLPIHDTLYRDGIVVDVHRHLLGPWERRLYNISVTDVVRFIEQPSIESDFVVHALKLFSEWSPPKVKILDMYLYECGMRMNAAVLDSVIDKWNAAFPCEVVADMISAFTGQMPPTATSLMSKAWRWRPLWVHGKYLLSLACHPRLRNVLAGPHDKENDAAQYQGSWLKRQVHKLFVFFGFRQWDLRWSKMGYGNSVH
jgi:hypothetical protein